MLDAYIIQKIKEDKIKKEQSEQEQPVLYIEEVDLFPKKKEKEENNEIVINL